ncbi:MAG: GspE/PulE family protein [Gemmataceae bacterium]
MSDNGCQTFSDNPSLPKIREQATNVREQKTHVREQKNKGLYFCCSLFPVPCSLFLLFAQTGFPRGEGFYYSIFKVLLFLALFFTWVWLCNWVNKDTEEVALPREMWNTILFASGVVTFLIVWIMPWFWISLPFVLIGIGTPTWVYVAYRNKLVRPTERVLTERHIRELLSKHLGLNVAPKDEEAKKNSLQLRVRFMARSEKNKNEGDTKRLSRVTESKGYKAAQEMVYDAVLNRTTDIHLEPDDNDISVRFRIDGVMHKVEPFGRSTGDAVINIFKILGNLDITEKRKPQDGAFSAHVIDRFVDFRVTTAGSVQGEKMVMRVLDRSKQIISLKKLGMREKMRDEVKSIVSQPHGMFLVCGPTGSGKSTTLYACMNEIDRYLQNIVTLEDPVEYKLPNVTQIEVNTKAGKTFANELRSVLRQDPDIIMVGEIRDQETAEIACQAAQTGHFVFSTLHANDTVSAIGRLMNLGVETHLIASSLTAILGQRLVRVLCPECKVRYRPNPETLRKANLPADKIKYFYRAGKNGPKQTEDEHTLDHDKSPDPICMNCGGTGYRGRTGIFELLVVTDKMREMIRENINYTAIRQEAIKNGMRYLYEDGFRQVIEGKTSIQELMRVTK